MGGLTTHALDLVHGGPAAGLQIDFFIQQDGRYVLHKTHITNAEGRTDALFLSADEMQAGRYQFLFHLGAYFARSALTQHKTRFLTRYRSASRLWMRPHIIMCPFSSRPGAIRSIAAAEAATCARAGRSPEWERRSG